MRERQQSICPVCQRLLEAEAFSRQGQVYLRKDCPEHGHFEARLFGDARLYARLRRTHYPPRPPGLFATPVERGCPYDCGHCPEHEQHMCVGIIEVNQACELECPLCLAGAGAHWAREGFQLSFEQVEFMLERFIQAEGKPEVVQFSGGEPSLHPRILDFIALALDKGISYVLLNTNGLRIARDDRFLEGLGRLKPHIYLQFDGFDPATLRALRGREGILELKLRALDRLAQADLRAVLVPAIEYGVNEHEIGPIVEFGLEHPAVFGVAFQSAFRAQRHPEADPLTRLTAPDIFRELEKQTGGMFKPSDFVASPCCTPTCAFATYALLLGDRVLPLPRVLPVEQHMQRLANRSMPQLGDELAQTLQRLWSAAATPGSQAVNSGLRRLLEGASLFAGRPGPVENRCRDCQAGLPLDQHIPRELGKHVFMVTARDFMDPWMFTVESARRCCIGELLPDGRAIPFCAYNALGYRQEAAAQLRGQMAVAGIGDPGYKEH